MMLHTKYQGSMPCGFRKEDLFTFSIISEISLLPSLVKIHQVGETEAK